MSTIPCHRGGHACTWPACALNCDGRFPAVPDCRPDLTGLDDGPDLPARKRPPAKTAAELAAIRARAWATRRARYGERGHSGSYRR